MRFAEQTDIIERMVETNRTMNFEELKAFDAVVRHGGITAAAKALGLSKSTISLQITHLEQRLGTRLLERSSRRMALTKEGEQVLPRIKSLLAEADHLVEDVSRSVSAPRGIVRAAVPPPLGGAVLEHLVPALSVRFPEISLAVASGYEIEDLQNPAFDFAIRAGRIHDDALVAKKVGEFVRILVCAPGHAAVRLASVDQLKNVDLLGFSSQSMQVEWVLRNRNDPQHQIALDCAARFAVQDFNVLQRLARSGHGAAMMPDFMVHDDIAAGRLTQVLPDWCSPPVDVMLAYRVGISKISRVAAVMEEAEVALRLVLSGA